MMSLNQLSDISKLKFPAEYVNDEVKPSLNKYDYLFWHLLYVNKLFFLTFWVIHFALFIHGLCAKFTCTFSVTQITELCTFQQDLNYFLSNFSRCLY